MSCVESLLTDLERLMLDEVSSDIKIVCQDQEMLSHSLILSARSILFKCWELLVVSSHFPVRNNLQVRE